MSAENGGKYETAGRRCLPAVDHKRRTMKNSGNERRRNRRPSRGNEMRRGICQLLFLLFALLCLLFAALLLSSWLAARGEQKQFEELAVLVQASEPQTGGEEGPDAAGRGQAETEDNQARFAELTGQNGDFAGWLSIADTGISYPVMSRPEEPDYYLNHGFDGEKSSSGVPFLGAGCDFSSDNIIIYGHNMKNGTMFAQLISYGDENYYLAHPYISFDTLVENGTYEIIAAFREQVHYQDETGVFRYYDYGGKLTEDTFRAYIANVTGLSLYDTGLTAEYGDRLLTLSTCSDHTGNGRFVVVAKKIR